MHHLETSSCGRGTAEGITDGEQWLLHCCQGVLWGHWAQTYRKPSLTSLCNSLSGDTERERATLVASEFAWQFVMHQKAFVLMDVYKKISPGSKAMDQLLISVPWLPVCWATHVSLQKNFCGYCLNTPRIQILKGFHGSSPLLCFSSILQRQNKALLFIASV